MKIKFELDTRSKLLKSAITIFGKYGFAGSSLRQIAELAGVNHSSVKHHYRNKDELWKATVSYLYSLMDDFVTKDEESYSQMEPRDVIITMTRNYILFAAKHPELARIRMFETIHESERLDWMTKHYLKPLTDRAIAGIEEGQARGIYTNKISAAHLHHINIAAVRTLYLTAPELERTMGVDVFSDEYIEEHISAVIEIMLNDPGSGESSNSTAAPDHDKSSAGETLTSHDFGKRIL